MHDSDFEGTLVLERLAEAGRLEDFWEAVDADDLEAAQDLLLAADLDDESVEIVLAKMRDPGEH